MNVSTSTATADDTSCITWLQISDWHHGDGDETTRTPIVEALIRDIKRQLRLRLQTKKLDFIVCNGDIANKGIDHEFELAHERLFEPLLKVTGVHIGNVMIVPGNHDINRGGFPEMRGEGLDLHASCQAGDWHEECHWNRWLNDNAVRKRLRRPFQCFRTYAETKFGIPNADWVYNRKYTVGVGDDEIDIHFACFNSSLFCGRQIPGAINDCVNKSPHDLSLGDYGNLFVGKRQWDDGLKSIPKNGLFPQSGRRAVRIAVLHHPFPWLLEADRNLGRSKLIDKFDFILFGHEHEQRVVEEKGTGGQCVVIPAGPAFEKRTLADGGDASHPNALAYNIVRLDLTSGKGEIFLRRYNPNIGRTGRFVRGYRSLNTPHGEYTFTLPKPQIPIINPADSTPGGDATVRRGR